MTDPIRVLLVDDDPGFAEVGSSFLQRADERIDVLTEVSADDGLAHIHSEQIDCVVSDYRMPGMNGLEFLEAVRSEYPELPFLLLTGQGSEEVASQALRAGATDYLQKGGASGSEQFELLANRVLNVVEQDRARRRAAELNRIRTLVSDVNQTLVRADSRGEIENRVCQILSTAEPYLFAWIGALDEDSGRLKTRAFSGDGGDFLTESITSGPGSVPEGEPVGMALRGQRSVVSQDLDNKDLSGSWREEALRRGFRSGAAVPLAHGENRYGALGIYAGRPGAFDTSEMELLEELADNIAHATHAAELRSTLRAERDQREALFNNAPVPVIAGEVAEEGARHQVTAVNDAFSEVFGYVPEAVLGRDIADVVVPEAERERHQTFRDRVAVGESTVAEVERITTEGPRDFLLHLIPYGTGDTAARGWYAWYTDITERRRQENRIAGLNQMMAEFMEAATVEHLGSILIDGAQGELDIPVAVLALFDESSGDLRPVARSRLAEKHLVESELFFGTEGPAWQAFVSDAADRIQDPAPELLDPSVGVETLHIHPLGRHGVLIAGTRSTDQDLIETVTGNLRTAIERLDRETRLKDREALLEEQNEWLDRLNRLNTVIRNIDQALVGASTRADIEEAVCTEITDIAGYTFAWIGEYDPTTRRIDPRQWAGANKGYLDTVSLEMSEEDSDAEPTQRAVDTREPQAVSSVISDTPYANWREAAVKRGYRSCLALPLLYRDTLYGVLTIYADEPDRFEELERQVLVELSETIAYAMNAVESKQALVSDEIQELELSLQATDVPLVQFIRDHPSGDFELKGIVPAGADEGFTVFYVTRGAPADEVMAFTQRSVAFADPELISEQGEECLFECTVTEESLLYWLLDRGAIPRGLSTDGGDARIRVELSRDADIRAFVESFQAAYPNTELVASRTRERPLHAREEFYASFLEALTSRQHEVLRRAFLSGYFESPREKTGQDIAASLGISQPTFSENLRTGLRKLLTLVFEENNANLDI